MLGSIKLQNLIWFSSDATTNKHIQNIEIKLFSIDRFRLENASLNLKERKRWKETVVFWWQVLIRPDRREKTGGSKAQNLTFPCPVRPATFYSVQFYWGTSSSATVWHVDNECLIEITKQDHKNCPALIHWWNCPILCRL